MRKFPRDGKNFLLKCEPFQTHSRIPKIYVFFCEFIDELQRENEALPFSKYLTTYYIRTRNLALT